MPVDRVTDFVASLAESELLTPTQLAEVRKLPEAQGDDPVPLARALVLRKWLTRYQVNEIAAGRGGELVLGSYVLLDLLGEGNMGQVFKAKHLHMKRIVALKVIRPEKLSNPKYVRRFRQEIQAAAQLTHPNIVLAYDAGQVGNTHFIAMEYVEGMDLARIVTEYGPLPIAQACEFLRQGAMGLQHAYERGLVHRDLKPSNLLVAGLTPAKLQNSLGSSLGGNNEGFVVKLLDLGLARLRSDGHTAGLTIEGAVVGTPNYLAPEQARDSRKVDVRADLYSLGCTFHFMLTGQEPFRADTVAEVLLSHQKDPPPDLAALRPGVPPSLQALFEKLLAKDPAKRFQTPAELAEALEPFCKGGGRPPSNGSIVIDPGLGRLVAPPDGVQEKTAPLVDPETLPSRRRTVSISLGWLWLALGGAVGIGLIVLLIVVLRPRPQNGEGTGLVNQGGETGTRQASGATPSGRVRPTGKQVDPLPNKRVAPLRTLGTAGGPIREVVLLAGRGEILVRTDLAVDVWNLKSGERQPMRSFAKGTSQANCISASSDGSQVVTCGGDGIVRLWDVATGKQLAELKTSLMKVNCITFLGHTNVAAFGGSAGDQKGEIYFWDLQTKQAKGPLIAKGGAVNCLASSSDGTRLLSGGLDSSVRFWKVLEQEQVWKVTGHTPMVSAVAFAPGEQTVVSCGADKTVRFWDRNDGNEQGQLGGEKTAVHTLLFSRDGTWLATAGGQGAGTGSTDCTIRLWDWQSKKEFAQCEGHKGMIAPSLVELEGRQLLSGSWDKTLRIWEVPALPVK